MLKQNKLDVERVREDFPILKRKVYGKQLVYLDNAATSQKPIQVINVISNYYKEYNANIHRAIHQLGEEATLAFENSREKIRKFINAKHSEEIIFTRGTTEAINLVSRSWGDYRIKKDDEILITIMEHHSNIIPWQLLAKRVGCKLSYVDITNDGLLKIDEFEKKVKSKKVKLVAITHASNVLGTINPIREIVKLAHEQNVLVLVDGAQSVPHMKVDVQSLDCDFLAFSAHKMLGPTGIGALYAKRNLLEEMEPFLGGGDMIKEVDLYNASWNDLPWKFEAGTSNIADVIGFGKAIDYLQSIGMDNVRLHEKELTRYALDVLSKIDGLKIYGTFNEELRAGVISFNLDNIHPHDVATILDREGVAIRSGHHCAQPLMKRLNVVATCRASFYIYNTKEEVDILVNAIKLVKRVFA
jgi:cysteine desulfurase/selenocysteine lyase